ncbi:MAG: peptidylprolyl isomerase [Sphingomonadaceae bacterium]
MMKLLASLLSALLLTIGTAHAQTEPAAAEPAPAPPPELVRVVLNTEMGPIILHLDKTNAPVTTGNFLRYVDEKRLDGTVFYRAMHLEWGTPPNGLIQGGTQNDPKRELPPIAHEPTNLTGIRHKTGTISMARYAPGTATGDFSIMLAPQPGLDAMPDAEDAEAQAGFAAFGQVVEGMETVRAIFNAPISQTKGEGWMRGQMIEKPVKILTAHRAPMPAPAPVPEPVP